MIIAHWANSATNWNVKNLELKFSSAAKEVWALLGSLVKSFLMWPRWNFYCTVFSLWKEILWKHEITVSIYRYFHKLNLWVLIPCSSHCFWIRLPQGTGYWGLGKLGNDDFSSSMCLFPLFNKCKMLSIRCTIVYIILCLYLRKIATK